MPETKIRHRVKIKPSESIVSTGASLFDNIGRRIEVEFTFEADRLIEGLVAVQLDGYSTALERLEHVTFAGTDRRDVDLFLTAWVGPPRRRVHWVMVPLVPEGDYGYTGREQLPAKHLDLFRRGKPVTVEIVANGRHVLSSHRFRAVDLGAVFAAAERNERLLSAEPALAVACGDGKAAVPPSAPTNPASPSAVGSGQP